MPCDHARPAGVRWEKAGELEARACSNASGFTFCPAASASTTCCGP